MMNDVSGGGGREALQKYNIQDYVNTRSHVKIALNAN